MLTNHPAPFKEVLVFPNYYEGHIIQWSLDPTFKGEEPYHFFVENAEVIDFSEISQTIDAGDLFFIRDASHIKQNHNDAYYYRVKLVTADNKVYYSNVLIFNADGVETHKFLYAAEMTRKEFVEGLFTMRPAWLMKRKSYGQIQRDQVDPVSGVPIADNPVDYGTGLAGGYYKPIKISYKLVGQDEDENLSQAGFGVNNITNHRLRIVGFPAVNRFDIIVNSQDERLVIMKVDYRNYPGTNIVILQNVAASRIAPTDSIYQIAMPAQL